MRIWCSFFFPVLLCLLPASSGAEGPSGVRSMTGETQSTATSVAPEIFFLVIRGDIPEEDPTDSDNDGVADDRDQCPSTAGGAVVDSDGCAQSQLDDDGDDVSNDLDQCPSTAGGAVVDSDGCAQSQLDDDGDDVSNDLDQCPATAVGAVVDSDGCAQSQLDGDNDGVSDAEDQCPNSSPGATVDAVGCEDLNVQVRAVYESDVNPLIVSGAGGCTSSGCHGRANAPGGLRLYPTSDSSNVQLNYDAFVSYIDRRSGNALLGKISGTSGHGGGVRFPTSSSEYQIIEDWVRSVEALP